MKTTQKGEGLQALLQQEAELTLLQINQKAYHAELKQRGLTSILNIGLAFSGKQFYVAS